MSKTFFLLIIVVVSLAFLSLSLLMTVYMIRRRKKDLAKSSFDKSLIEKYQKFLSNMIILPELDDNIFMSTNESNITERLNHTDISDKYRRRILIEEIYSFKKYLQGNQAAQMVSYFFGLGLQEDVEAMFSKTNWTEKLIALKYAQAFGLKECLPQASLLIEHNNKDLSFQAMLTKLSLENNFESIKEFYSNLNNWEKHKLQDLAKNQGIAIDQYLPKEDSTLINELVSI